MFELGSKIQSQVQSEMEKGQREYFLRQQLKAIQQELGEGDPEQAEVNELRERLAALDAARGRAEGRRPRARPARAAPAGGGRVRRDPHLPRVDPDAAVGRRYTEDNLDLEHARKVLDDDHFDLEKVKERIVEHLAVAKLRNEISGQILCFVGPPGVGKTSLGQSIARALGRKFVRMSVGGVRDEAEIRGHRRTYIGAMPGTIIRSLRDAESRNPVILIDEIDKMGADFRGDPSSAMLEVLDPEQNKTFRDHYLDLPFDLSKVLFICTANTLDTIPGPLLDRMDTISSRATPRPRSSAIAKRYLLPKQLAAHGLKRSQLTISDTMLRTIIREYTREAGVRNLERRLADVCRKAATQVAKGKTQKTRVDDKRLREWLGPRRFSGEVRRRTSEPGVATGLAYTAAGGDVLFIEATAYPGKGELTLTGQLGDVMKESAQAALSWVRSHTAELGVADDWFEEHDIHIHVPAGAVPKDGPSAGVTIATAIASLVRGEPVADDVGMTGEITLTGQVLPIGGIREKSLAAQRAGLKRVILPRENETDLGELPPETREALEFIPADTIEDVFAAAFDGAPARRGRARPRPVDRQAGRGASQRAGEKLEKSRWHVVRPDGACGGRGAGTRCLPREHERDLLTSSPLEVDLVRARLAAGDADRAVGSRPCRRAGLRERRATRVELRARGRRRARAWYGLPERGTSHLDEVDGPVRRGRCVPRAASPSSPPAPGSGNAVRRNV